MSEDNFVKHNRKVRSYHQHLGDDPFVGEGGTPESTPNKPKTLKMEINSIDDFVKEYNKASENKPFLENAKNYQATGFVVKDAEYVFCVKGDSVV